MLAMFPKLSVGSCMEVTICIITFKRTVGLERLLQSLIHLRFKKSEQPLIEILIVDNDKSMSAKVIADKMKRSLQWPIKYLVEEKRGIPFARNTALANSKNSDYIAFIDDDEIATGLWLDELLYALNKYEADVVGGPVLSLFESPPPDWIFRGGFFDRPRQQTGMIYPFAASGNVLIKSRIINNMSVLFDESFGMAGGTDTDFFLRLHESGYKIVWCNEAIVEEWVPSQRISLQWLLKRSFRKGNSGALYYIKNKNMTHLTNGIKKSVRLLMCFLEFPISLFLSALFWDRLYIMKTMIKTSSILGSLLSTLDMRYEDYKTIK
jgi:glycosyltransferase involved in cell wall biosynthesis